MNVEEFREYCISKDSVEECFPFDDYTLVFKVLNPWGDGRMFGVISLSKPQAIYLKCDPDRAEDLRMRYPDDIQPAFHFNKRHWNGVRLDGVLAYTEICEMIDHSYTLVQKALPKSKKSRV